MPPVTTRQLAELAGCSRTTVSLALRNHPRIPPKTRRKIVELARKMGYQRDPLISTMMTRMRVAHKMRSVEKLAYLTWWDTPRSLAKPPHDTSGFQAACRRARELGYEIEEFWAKAPGLSSTRLNKILYTRGIRGVLVGGLYRPLGHVRLEWSRLAAVMLGYSLANHGINRVGPSHFQGMILAMRMLKHRGYQRIGFTSLTDQSERTNQGWLGGYLTCQYQQSQKMRMPPLIVSQWDQKKFAVWVEKYKPDAVVSNIEDPLSSLRQLGYRIPQEIGFASLDRMRPTDPYAGIDQLRAQFHVAAVELLVSQLENNQFGLFEHPKTVQIDSIWRDGPTVRASYRVDKSAII